MNEGCGKLNRIAGCRGGLRELGVSAAGCRRGFRALGQDVRGEFGFRMRGNACGLGRWAWHRWPMTRTVMPPMGEWEKGADLGRIGDPLWTVQAYRISLYAIECHNFDRRLNAQLSRAPSFDQLTRAVGSISANIAEGYSRSSIADRTRFYGYALGSTREAIAWYDTLTTELGSVVGARQDTLIQIRRLLLTMLRRTRPEGPVLSMRDAPRRPRDSDQ